MAVFWVVAPCSPVEVYCHFGCDCRLHHQGYRPDGGRQGPLKHRLPSSRLHSATAKKTAIFGHILWRNVLLNYAEWMSSVFEFLMLCSPTQHLFISVCLSRVLCAECIISWLYLSVSPFNSTQEPLDASGWKLCHSTQLGFNTSF
jgi:hypothetical protein